MEEENNNLDEELAEDIPESEDEGVEEDENNPL